MTDSFSAAELAALPKAEFAFPGALRDRLVAAILDGTKTSTTGLVVDYEHEGEALPVVGERSVVVDSDGRPVGVIEVTGVRANHEMFWHSGEMREALGDPGFKVTDDTLAVLERFRLVGDLRGR
ncbi:ASCH domain-containing protein [Kribbella sp. WER1]